MKIRSVGAELFYADGQTDMTKLTVAFTMLRRRLKRHSECSVFGSLAQSLADFRHAMNVFVICDARLLAKSHFQRLL